MERLLFESKGAPTKAVVFTICISLNLYKQENSEHLMNLLHTVFTVFLFC